MIFSKSITFDDEEIGRAEVSPKSMIARVSDEALFIEKFRSGDEVAFETLIDRYSGDIYSLLYRLTSDEEDAKDLSQETFLRALRSIKSFRGDSTLKTWLFRIAINESRNRFRWWKRRRKDATISIDMKISDTERTIAETISDGRMNPEESALTHERENALKSTLAEISDVYREAIVLCDIEGLSYDETAAALGVSIGTVKSRISRGREELRRRLKDF